MQQIKHTHQPTKVPGEFFFFFKVAARGADESKEAGEKEDEFEK